MAQQTGEFFLEARGVNKKFGAVTAASDINVGITQHSVVGLIGSNGAGKTTFINMVTGYLKPSSGSILFQGRDITSLIPRQVTNLGICRSFQIPQLFGTMTARQNLRIPVGIGARHPGAQRMTDAQEMATVAAVLERFGLTGCADQVSAQLPEGTRKLLDIAMAMAGNPEILLLDEPTSGVSAEEKFLIMDMVMGALAASRTTVLFVEHDMEIVERYASRVLAFYDGRIIADGNPQTVLTDPEVRRYVIGEHVLGQGHAGGSHA